MDAKRLADKYITRSGGIPPKPKRTTPPERNCKGGAVTLTEAEYKRLLEAAECDDMIGWCESCNAWIDKNDEAWIQTDDYRGCVYAGSLDERYRQLCRRSRALPK